MQNATFLFATGYFARLCLSSHLIAFNYEAAAKNVRVPGHRSFVVLFCEYLVAIRRIGGPGAVQVERTGRKANDYTNGRNEYSSTQV
ncbi:MAG: hypothetical protein WBG10_01520 [Pseudolabrys sp.]